MGEDSPRHSLPVHGSGRPADAGGVNAQPPADAEAPLEERVRAQLKTIYDPELPLNIYDLGLIYDVQVDEAGGDVYVKMTLTTPACPVAQSMPGMVEAKVKELPGVESARVELVWDPPWSKDMLSEAAKLELGLF